MSQTRSGYRSSPAGMVGALLATLALVATVFLLTRLHGGSTDEPAQTVDYTAELARARSEAPFDVLAPGSVPAGWRATSVSWQGAGPEKSWHLGFLTDGGEYVGLEQGNATVQDFVADHTRADRPGSPVTIGGQRWQTLTGGGDTALVRFGKRVTTLVTGSAPEPQLVAFATSLSGLPS